MTRIELVEKETDADFMREMLARLSRGYGPYATVYNRFNCWSRRKVWHRIHQALVK